MKSLIPWGFGSFFVLLFFWVIDGPDDNAWEQTSTCTQINLKRKQTEWKDGNVVNNKTVKSICSKWPYMCDLLLAYVESLPWFWLLVHQQTMVDQCPERHGTQEIEVLVCTFLLICLACLRCTENTKLTFLSSSSSLSDPPNMSESSSSFSSSASS